MVQMKTVAIVDYGMSNVDSVRRAVEECGGRPIVTSSANDLERASYIILPGVGSFPKAMKNLKERGLVEPLTEQVMTKQIPFLGVCLGMQLLATQGFEVESADGLGFIPGEVRRLEPSDSASRIPHVGWNTVSIVRENPLFRGIEPGSDFYFVHSYHLLCADESDVVARTPYCGEFVSAVMRQNIFGTQFHPEKSQKKGFQVLRNFLSM